MLNKIEQFKQKLGRYTERERGKIIEAAEWSKELHRDQQRASGEPYFIHPLQVAEILVDMQLDCEAVIAALLHDVIEDTVVDEAEVRRRFGRQIASMVNGVTKISIVKAKSKRVQESETIRKMLFAMTKDIRVIIIKLADKYHNMSTLEFLPRDKSKRIAKECLDIYAPLADRLGISWMKVELEDLALKELNPDTYNYIKKYLSNKKLERSTYLRTVERQILTAARKEGVEVRISTRVKHVYSIYQKMKRRGKDIDEIYDLLGIRVLCDSSNECYTLLGVIHKLWPPIEGRFKDYIAMPKANHYQSLHTTVMCNGGKLIEIQVRTHQMHQTAEFGVAAHWAYKREFSGARIKPEELPIINKLKQWNRTTNADTSIEEIKSELLKDSIFVFTPRGHIVELPKKSTAIDFAYHIHTEVGNHTIGAKADGSIIPLNQALKNTQVIEILTANNAKPHVNWLKFARTSRARQKIRHWLNKHEENLFIDKSIIAKKRVSHPEEKQAGETQEKCEPKPAEKETIIKQVVDQAKIAFRIGNEKNMLISIAKCCTPSSGDDIIGYVSRGRGIIVHRRDCPNLKHIQDFEARSIEVEWETASPKAVRKFRVSSRMTSDLFSEIEGAVRKYRGHLIEGKLEEDEEGNLRGRFSMELEKAEDFKKVLKSIRTIPAVINIQPL
ncbi:MAG TPA: bifunctional (p)ppGpp synthetase/guanosine-3',5'-bis(diphosphate) 3'-pyrophosphohydrolase [Sediminispirochaeta sp.]|nr:bifunctional (p)ppGpp synthetase/guanosine-3',5'-bis(diphosphate) 3'-pyrophosphohydrolase [Sediminispirochaeta sp.]